MRTKKEETMNRIQDFIGDYYRANHRTPTTREIAGEVQLSNGAAHKYLVAMNERGMLRYENGVLSGIDKVSKTLTGYFSAPLVGSIACGDPEHEEENVEAYISLPEGLFGKGDFYLLKATGDSMEDDGIYDGDYVLIRKQTDCQVGDIVVALDDENNNTLKRYAGIDPRSRKAVLKYANEAVYPGRTILVDSLTVQGVAKNVFHYL